MLGAISFVAAEFLYGSRGPDSGAIQFILYGLVGFIPATVSSWLSHRLLDQPTMTVASVASPSPTTVAEKEITAE